VVVGVVAAVTTATTRAGTGVMARQRAQSVADVAALAGVARDPEAAHRVARTNGGRVVAMTRRADGALEVTVSLGRASASAAAAMP
jgi:hypothetical protein